MNLKINPNSFQIVPPYPHYWKEHFNRGDMRSCMKFWRSFLLLVAADAFFLLLRSSFVSIPSNTYPPLYLAGPSNAVLARASRGEELQQSIYHNSPQILPEKVRRSPLWNKRNARVKQVSRSRSHTHTILPEQFARRTIPIIIFIRILSTLF